MDILQTVLAVVNVVAVILAPAMAVGTGRIMQNMADKRKDKMEIFETLLTDRSEYPTKETEKAHNLVLLVFGDNKKVCDAWIRWYDLTEAESTENETVKEAYDELLSAMAVAVGYRNNMDGVLQRPATRSK